jgi:hypothetical protein
VPVQAHASLPSLDSKSFRETVVSSENQPDPMHSNNLLAVELESENDGAR